MPTEPEQAEETPGRLPPDQLTWTDGAGRDLDPRHVPWLGSRMGEPPATATVGCLPVTLACWIPAAIACPVSGLLLDLASRSTSTLSHVVLMWLVILAAAIGAAWSIGSRSQQRIGISAVGFALAGSTYWSVACIPVNGFAFVVLLVGTPIAALVGNVMIYRFAASVMRVAGRAAEIPPRLWLGVVLYALPAGVVTWRDSYPVNEFEQTLLDTTSANRRIANQALIRLDANGFRNRLLRRAWGEDRGGPVRVWFVEWLAHGVGRSHVDADRAQAVYEQLTGIPFEQAPRPRQYRDN